MDNISWSSIDSPQRPILSVQHSSDDDDDDDATSAITLDSSFLLVKQQEQLQSHPSDANDPAVRAAVLLKATTTPSHHEDKKMNDDEAPPAASHSGINPPPSAAAKSDDKFVSSDRDMTTTVIMPPPTAPVVKTTTDESATKAGLSSLGTITIAIPSSPPHGPPADLAAVVVVSNATPALCQQQPTEPSPPPPRAEQQAPLPTEPEGGGNTTTDHKALKTGQTMVLRQPAQWWWHQWCRNIVMVLYIGVVVGMFEVALFWYKPLGARPTRPTTTARAALSTYRHIPNATEEHGKEDWGDSLAAQGKNVDERTSDARARAIQETEEIHHNQEPVGRYQAKAFSSPTAAPKQNGTSFFAGWLVVVVDLIQAGVVLLFKIIMGLLFLIKVIYPLSAEKPPQRLSRREHRQQEPDYGYKIDNNTDKGNSPPTSRDVCAFVEECRDRLQRSGRHSDKHRSHGAEEESMAECYDIFTKDDLLLIGVFLKVSNATTMYRRGKNSLINVVLSRYEDLLWSFTVVEIKSILKVHGVLAPAKANKGALVALAIEYAF